MIINDIQVLYNHNSIVTFYSVDASFALFHAYNVQQMFYTQYLQKNGFQIVKYSKYIHCKHYLRITLPE